MSQTTLAAPTRQRALVVEPDLELRHRLTQVLREHGLEVMECADVDQGRELFTDHRLVVAPLNGDNAAMKEFVAWVRAEAGVSQPWIIALGVRHVLAQGETPAHYGVNDLLTGPVDSATLVKRLEDLGLGRAARSAAALPPSYHRARAATPPSPSAWDAASAPVLLEHFPAAVAILDRSMHYLAVNSRWMREFQIPAPTLTGRSHYDVFPDLHPDWRGLYERCLADDQKQTIDDVMMRPDGTKSHVHWEIQPWHGANETVGGLVLTCASMEPAPVPPAPEAATGLPLLPDASFREMAEAAPFGMVLLDDEAHVLYANPQHSAVLGFGAETGEPIQSWLERACAGDEVFQKRALDEWWESVWRRRTPLTCSLRNAEGLVKDIEFRPAALSGDRLLLTIFDVTDARLDEQAMRTSEARYRGLFQQASAALLIINPAGNITEINPSFETLTGLPRHEARRAALTDFLPDETVGRLRAATLAGGHAGGFLSTLRHHSGTITPVQLSVAVIRNDHGQPAFTACLLSPLPTATPGTAWETITPDWLFLLDGDGTILEHTTPRDFAALQADPATPLKGELLDTVLPALTAPLPLDVMMERLLDSPGLETRCEYTMTLPETAAPRRIEARLILLSGGPPSRFGLTLRDVTRARSASSPGGFSTTLLEHLHTPVILTNERGRILHLNPAAETVSGYTAAELRDGGLFRLFRPDAPREFSEELSSHLRDHRSWHAGASLTSKDGRHTPGSVELTPAFDEASGARGFILLFRPDADPTSAATARPAISLHRARNDLQILTSLMALQADQTEEPAVRAALLASQDRLGAVALIYRLVRHEHDPVDFARFTREIGRNLLDAHRRPAGAITIDPLFSGIALPQRLAISLGLILEELLTASLQWSFPAEDATGLIRLTLTTDAGEAVLILRDNGQPLTGALRAQRESTFSHRLVQLLAEQIGGSLTYLSDPENQARLSFHLPGLDPQAGSGKDGTVARAAALPA